MRSSYDKEEVEDNVSFDDMKQPNNPERYLRSGRNSMKREMGETKGSKMKPEYGTRNKPDVAKNMDKNDKRSSDARYADRGDQSTPDDKKLNQQNLPNTRMYTYVQ